MGGKSYFCDFCNCFIKNDINVRKTHNNGLSHKIAKTSFMRKYEHPRKIYNEEIEKIPCTRYIKGYCKFDLLCQYTHFNKKQLEDLLKIADQMDAKNKQEQHQSRQSETSFCKPPSLTKSPAVTWLHKVCKENRKTLPKRLPPSLRTLNLKKLIKHDFIKNRNSWG